MSSGIRRNGRAWKLYFVLHFGMLLFRALFCIFDLSFDHRGFNNRGPAGITKHHSRGKHVERRTTHPSRDAPPY
ncbi:hypothetical protein HDV57DRAFT_484101 [Trichoderma longibrachiatum]